MSMPSTVRIAGVVVLQMMRWRADDVELLTIAAGNATT